MNDIVDEYTTHFINQKLYFNLSVVSVSMNCHYRIQTQDPK